MVGMLTVGLGLLGASLVVLIFQDNAPDVLEGFGFGAALLAMFMRVGGGIFTKAADVGADLVGKVEQNIPEDDPRNAATIADNVGDNVGDCAGMAADLFESYAVTLVAALILGSQAFGDKGLVFPLLIPAIGALTAVAGVYLTKPKAGENGLTTINRSFYLSSGIAAVASVVLAYVYLPSSFGEFNNIATDLAGAEGDPRFIAASAVVIGIVMSAGILALTGYYTGTEHRPVKDVGKTSLTGAATVILSGLSVGFESAVYTTLVIGARRVRCLPPRWRRAHRVAVRGRARRLWSADHGRRHRRHGHLRPGLRQRAGHRRDVGRRQPRGRPDPHRARRRRQHHEGDHQGHRDRDGRAGRDRAVRLLRDHGLRVAARTPTSTSTRPTCSTSASSTPPSSSACSSARPWCSSSRAWRSTRSPGPRARWSSRYVASSARSPASWRAPAGRSTARSSTSSPRTPCASWSRRASSPCSPPIAVGFGLGVTALAGFLAGAIGAGTLMAVFLANSGGAWDNAKKLVEDGNHGGKGSAAHEATIIGDTVGDPFKDTAGPAINPLIKVMNLVSLLIASAIVSMSVGDDQNDALRIVIALVAVAIIAAAIYISKQRAVTISDDQTVDSSAA